MQTDTSLLPLVKEAVTAILPDARVLLFGSRVTGKFHDESDWDILILTQTKYPKSTKAQIQDKLFPLSVSFASFINLLLVQEDEWYSSPAYYSLRLSIGKNLIAA